MNKNNDFDMEAFLDYFVPPHKERNYAEAILSIEQLQKTNVSVVQLLTHPIVSINERVLSEKGSSIGIILPYENIDTDGIHQITVIPEDYIMSLYFALSKDMDDAEMDLAIQKAKHIQSILTYARNAIWTLSSLHLDDQFVRVGTLKNDEQKLNPYNYQYEIFK